MTTWMRANRLTIVGLLIVIALIVLAPSFLGRYQLMVLEATLISFCLAVSFNVIGGFAGQVSFGTAAFFGLGAYTQAILSSHGVPVAIGFAAAGLVATISSLIVVPCFRTSGLFFAIITLAMSAAAQILVQMYAPGGARGIYIASTPEPIIAYYTVAAISFLALIASWWIRSARFGLALQSIRDDATTAGEYGVETIKWKACALFVSAFIAGVTGAAYAWINGFVDPKVVMNLQYSLNPMLITIIGGAGAVFGPFFGALVWVALGEVFRTITDNALINQMVYAALLIVLVMFAPYGIVGTWVRRRANRKHLRDMAGFAAVSDGERRSIDFGQPNQKGS